MIDTRWDSNEQTYALLIGVEKVYGWGRHSLLELGSGACNIWSKRIVNYINAPASRVHMCM